MTSIEPTSAPSTLETPTTSYDPSDTDSTQPTTPSSAAVPTPRQQPSQPNKSAHRSMASVSTIVPAIPNIPLPSRPSKHAPASTTSESGKAAGFQPSNRDRLANAVDAAAQAKAEDSAVIAEQTTPTTSPPKKEAPKSWADLVRTIAPPKSTIAAAEANVVTQTNGITNTKTASLSEALSSYSVAEARENSKIAFLEPRGLVNTGNMCYMNSVSSELTGNLLSQLMSNARYSRF